VGGFLLRHSADIERQALRTQQLAGAAVQLQGFSSEAQTEGLTKRVVADREQALALTASAFADVRSHGRAEASRIESAYLAYVRSSTREFEQVRETGLASIAQQRDVDRLLSRFESLIGSETRTQTRTTTTINPEARLALITAAVAAALLVGLLIWQFELQRRAGRIDRDHAARAEELVRLRDEFVASVSHELRTPLTSIIGYLELINDESATLTTDQQAFLAVVQRSAKRLYQLVGELLLVAEVEDGQLALDLQDVDLDALAAQCVEASQPAADAKQIELRLILGSPGHIQGDPTRLAQMMDNLVSNAIKFTPAGGRVSVRTGVLHGQTLFEVTDTGQGISPAEQTKVFDRFFRSQATIHQAIGGAGLGLTITRAIVDAHHGSITLESVPGKQTIFQVRLPYPEESIVPPPSPTR
jgi:signal transduction histidine kinase